MKGVKKLRWKDTRLVSGEGEETESSESVPKKLLKDIKLVPKPKTQHFSCCSTSSTCAILARKQNSFSAVIPILHTKHIQKKCK